MPARPLVFFLVVSACSSACGGRTTLPEFDEPAPMGGSTAQATESQTSSSRASNGDAGLSGLRGCYYWNPASVVPRAVGACAFVQRDGGSCSVIKRESYGLDGSVEEVTTELGTCPEDNPQGLGLYGCCVFVSTPLHFAALPGVGPNVAVCYYGQDAGRVAESTCHAGEELSGGGSRIVDWQLAPP